MSANVPERAAARAAEMIPDNAIIGLGTGRAATAFLHALARRIHDEGLSVRGVPSSEATARLADHLRIPITDLASSPNLDVTVDGADEISNDLDAIKGLGGALLREKVLAAASRRWILVVDPSKRVTRLGRRGTLHIEVVPFAAPLVQARLAELVTSSVLRQVDGGPYLTDNGNLILDCAISVLPDPAALENAIHRIPGVVTTGLFLGLSPVVLVERADGVEEILPGPV